jgi:hypothetical protein
LNILMVLRLTEATTGRPPTKGDNAVAAPPDGRTPRIAVALPSDTRVWVEGIAQYVSEPPAATVSILLGAMHEILSRELRRIPLTVAEADALASIVGNDFQLGFTVGGLRTFASVSEAFELAHQTLGGISSYANRFSIDEDQLLTKLRRLGPAADLALRMALAQCGDAEDTYEDAATVDTNTPAMKYGTVGLTIIDTPQAAP